MEKNVDAITNSFAFIDVLADEAMHRSDILLADAYGTLFAVGALSRHTFNEKQDL